MNRSYTKLSDPITDAEREAYRACHYACPVPPVCTVAWDEDDWIRYVRFNLRLADAQRTSEADASHTTECNAVNDRSPTERCTCGNEE